MRHLFRPLAHVLAAAALVMAGSSSALAAASPTSASLDASWCMQYGTTETCYDIDGTIRFLDTSAGSSIQINKIIRTTVYESGQFAGETMSVTMNRGVFEADGTFVIDTVTNTRSTVDGEPCRYRLVMRLVDFEAVVFQTTSTCEA